MRMLVSLLCILIVFYPSEGTILRQDGKELTTSLLVDQLNSYIDRTIDLVNRRPINSSDLPNHFVKGTWGYLLLDVEYSLKLYNGSVTGLRNLQRSGDAFIHYDKTTGNLTVSATVIFQQIQACYEAEVKVYGVSHQGSVTSFLPGLNVSMSLSVSSANLRVSLDSISVATTQDPIVTFSSSDLVMSYFAPVFSALPALSSLTVDGLTRWSIQSTVNILNNPNFGYY